VRALQHESSSRRSEVTSFQAQPVAHGKDHRTSPLSHVDGRFLEDRLGRTEDPLSGDVRSLIPLGDEVHDVFAQLGGVIARVCATRSAIDSSPV